MEELAELVRTKLAIKDADSTATKANSQDNWQLVDTQAIAKRTRVISRERYPLIGTAVLELAPTPLHQQILEFAKIAQGYGYKQIELLPIFLLPGVHVREDIPREVALAQEKLGQAVVLKQRPHLGAHPGLATIFQRKLATVEADVKILLSHGTRRRGGNQVVEALADKLGAVSAYWSVQPTLEEQIKALADAGYQQMAIAPYFLFSGGITDAIAQSVDSIQKQFSKLDLNLCNPIGVSWELADLVVDLIEE
jgi:sirohydrochlorin cobaltochelatase